MARTGSRMLRNALVVLSGAMTIAVLAEHAALAAPQDIPGNPQRGKELIAQFGCGTCHLIPGVKNADALVAPPLISWQKRIYIAGLLRNTPDNLQRWIQHPQQIVPNNAMPDMGITDEQAQDIVAYLYTLK